MGLEEYRQGFLLAEVPLGTGILDLPRVVRALRAARPEIRLNIEMITRDPLKVPCLTEGYWVTFADLPGAASGPRDLARPRPPSERSPTANQHFAARRSAPCRGRKRASLPRLRTRSFGPVTDAATFRFHVLTLAIGEAKFTRSGDPAPPHCSFHVLFAFFGSSY